MNVRMLLLAICSAAVAGPAAYATTSRYPDDHQSFPLVERGRYLAVVADCSACHTAEGGKPFAGGRVIPTPFGNMVSPNITPDRDTGIGGWTDEAFYNALHKGTNDVRLYPAMPYTYYTKMTREDVLAIRAYLNTLPPVRNDVTSNTLPFPFNIRLSMAVWNALFFTEGEWKPQPGKSAEWNRGGYLVEGPGHCGACHTPKNFLGGDNDSQHLQGYSLQGWFAPDITNAERTGLAAWTVEDIVEYLKTGANRFAVASGPMAEEITDSSSKWTLSDLRAAATYLKDQPSGKETAPKPLASADPRMKAGEAIYVDQCAACHAMSGDGIARMFPTLKGSAAVQAREPTSLLQVVLNGTRAISTVEAPTGPAMPAFNWKLSDAQVAAVTTYIRNAWGNAASPVSTGDVQNVRQSSEAGD